MSDDDLVTFLRARLDEDEAVTHGTEWCAATRTFNGWDAHRVDEDDCEIRSHDATIARNVGPEIAAHIARHDPARVLAEVDAKRQILPWHSTQHTVVGGFCADEGGPCTHRGEAECALCGGTACATLRLLALPYADHPDYREEWRP